MGRTPVVLAVLLAGLYAALTWVFADRLIGGQFVPPDEEANVEAFGLPQPEVVTIANGPVELAGWFFANPRDEGCAAIVLHGFTGNQAQMLGPAATLFYERGCHVLTYDLRGHGASSRGLLTYGALDRADLLAAIDWLKGETGLAEDRIGLWGVSYGAATSIQAASERSGLAFVIADATFSSLADIAAVRAERQYGAWAGVLVPGALFVAGLRGGFDPAEASPVAAIERVTSPTLLVHSTTDEFTPSEHSEAILAASDRQLTVLELTTYGAPHGASFWTDPVTYAAFVDAFLDEFVPGFGSRSIAAG